MRRLFIERVLYVWTGIIKGPTYYDPMGDLPPRFSFSAIIRPRRDLARPGWMIPGWHIELWMDWIDFELRVWRVKP